MDHDDDTLAACAATDLVACLRAQLHRTRARRRAADLQYGEALLDALAGRAQYPTALAAILDELRAECAALQIVLDDLDGERSDCHVACA